MQTRPATRSGRCQAASSAINPPLLCDTSTAGPVRSSTASSVLDAAGMVENQRGTCCMRSAGNASTGNRCPGNGVVLPAAPMRYSDHISSALRATGASGHMPGSAHQPARPRSTPSMTCTGKPARRKSSSQPGRLSGVVSHIDPVRQPPWMSTKGGRDPAFSGTKLCT